MARLDILAPFILSWEGGYNKTKGDRGGATNKGVTLETWRRYGYDKNGDRVINEKDVMLITEADAVNRILRPVYWNKWRADEIQCQAIANLVVDWYWNSGIYGIKIPQKVLGVTIDGSVGAKTLAAITPTSASSTAGCGRSARSTTSGWLQKTRRRASSWQDG